MLIIIIFLIFLLYKMKTDIKTVSNYTFTNSFTNTEIKILTTLANRFKYLKNGEVSLEYILATIWQESIKQVLAGIPNNKVFGDNNNSIGYFQINKFGAFPEVRTKEKLNHKFEDLANEKINAYYGIKYLSYCINSGLKQSKNKPLHWLVAKKYNGGLDETETSNNKMAENYADSYSKKFLKTKEFIKLNIKVL